jgi:hypothetical protein
MTSEEIEKLADEIIQAYCAEIEFWLVKYLDVGILRKHIVRALKDLPVVESVSSN